MSKTALLMLGGRRGNTPSVFADCGTTGMEFTNGKVAGQTPHESIGKAGQESGAALFLEMEGVLAVR